VNVGRFNLDAKTIGFSDKTKIIMKIKVKQRESLDQILKRTAEVMMLDDDQDISVHSRDSDGDTPLHKVATWGDRHAILTLVEAGAEIDAKGDMGCTPLYFAVMGNHVQAVEQLLLLGANPNIVTELEFSPKTLAKENGNKEMINIFSSTFPSKGRK
jgi:ankyrin repeat protein